VSSAWTAAVALARRRSRTSTSRHSCAETADRRAALTANPDDAATLSAAHDVVRRRIAAACLRSGRRSDDVRLLPVSKGVPVARLRAALAAGIVDFGENRVQEAEVKAGQLVGARWELVGRLQGNKAARALAVFGAIHSVDSLELAQRLDRLAVARVGDPAARRPVPVFLQVNVDDDPAKAGFLPAALESALAVLAALTGLELRGLMTIGRMVDRPEQARPTFAALRDLSLRLRQLDPRLGAELSMGMTDDFEVAVEEGATVVRVGRAIFGARPAG
jgi:PLP dependent protein